MKNRYRVNIDDALLDDLSLRLMAIRWTNEIDNNNWESGTNKSYLKALCNYWQNGFNWRKQEAYLNSFNHYITTLGKLPIHFIFEKGKAKSSMPLLLIHGFPDSFYRFHKLISLLTQADENGFSFDVIVPSIPGYGFSGVPKVGGMTTNKIAALFTDLMTQELGYTDFLAHGGDWGSSIIEKIAIGHGNRLIGMHLTDIPFNHTMEKPENCSPAETAFFEKIKEWQQKDGAYNMIQSTKPQSLGYGLNDSPVGLAAWIIDKFHDWSDNDGNIENAFTKDELLTNIMIYWSTQTINAAMRLYFEEMVEMMQSKNLSKKQGAANNHQPLPVPAALTVFLKDIAPAPREFAERFFNIQRFTEIAKGGHFAAMEQPLLLAEDIRQFARQL